MNNNIIVSLPLNVSPEEMPLFEPFLTYKLKSQKVKKLRNVFVTYSGFCINSKGLIKESHHAHHHQIKTYRNEAAYYYKDVTDNPENLITLNNNNTYLLIHHPWYNYYHWICECIFRAWMIKDEKDEMILLLPDYYQQSDFIMGSLEPFKFKHTFIIPASKSLWIKKLCLPQIKETVDSYDYKMIAQVKFFYLNYVSKIKNLNIDLGERVYISRKKSLRRKVENEEEIEPILLKYNFKILNNENYTFLEQVSIYSNAKFLVSIHGSGLTNMIFMKEDSVILEFHKKKTNDKDWHSKAFWYLSDALGYQYFQQLCNPTDVNDDYFNANFIVNTVLLEKNLGMMFAQ